jgi:SET domain-containing protein
VNTIAEGIKMLLVKTSLRPSPIHGMGCFTEEKILKGQVIWEFDERIDLRIRMSELETFPAPIQEFLKIYGYTEMYHGEKVIILCGDHSRHFNHSDHPNLIDTEAISFAAREIEAGEELTCNYHSFDLDADTRW